MKKALVAYFSASGVTRSCAETLANAAHAYLYEIKPAELYTAADLDWTNSASRSTVEMKDLNCRPALAEDSANIADYEVIFIGFPVWWGREPSVIDTFIEANDFTGKCVVPFFTSGGGGLTNRAQLEKLLPGIAAHKALTKSTTVSDLSAWLDGILA